MYAALFIGWIFLPPLVHHVIEPHHSALRFFATEAVLTVLLVISVFFERPNVTLRKTHDTITDNDIRYIIASKMTMQRHFFRWLLLLWFPLTVLYILAAVANSLQSLTVALLIVTLTILFLVIIYLLFFVRSSAATAAASTKDNRRYSTNNADIEQQQQYQQQQQQQHHETQFESARASSSLSAASAAADRDVRPRIGAQRSNSLGVNANNARVEMEALTVNS
jgi:ABC-type transport system involved in cytochrome bd biosynthesis fused ATPase/permease subunit